MYAILKKLGTIPVHSVFFEAPFLRILLPTVLGILAGIFCVHTYMAVLAAGLGGLTLLSLFRLHKGFNLNQVHAWGGLANLLWVCFGYLLGFFNHWQTYPAHFQQFINSQKPQLYKAIVSQPPQARSSNLRVLLSIAAIQDTAQNWHSVEGQVQASIALDSLAGGLKYGDELLIQSQLRPISPPLNPEGLDLRNYYRVQHIYHQTYVPELHWTRLSEGHTSAANGFIYALRDYLTAIFKKHCPTPNEQAVASALVLGVRAEISSEVTNAYADTGAMHVLSVSGLHVGLIAVSLVWFFRRIPIKARWWKWARLLAVLALIWLFAILTGATPPALRSAAMFSFTTIGQFSNRRLNIYNSLAVSAFFLLCINPLWILDVGFQLSYLALWGIVFFYRRIHGLLIFRNTWIDAGWGLTAVSLAATISTLPISLYYFHQFSFISFLSGVVVIPLSTLILQVGMLVLGLDFVPILSDWLGWVFYLLVWLLNASIFLLQKIPFLIIEGVWLSFEEMWGWYLTFICLAIALELKNYRWYLAGHLLILGMFGYRCWTYQPALEQRVLTIYHLHKGSMLACFLGTEGFSLVDSLHLQTPKSLDFTQQNHLYAARIRSHTRYCVDTNVLEKPNFYKNAQILAFENFKLGILDKNALVQSKKPIFAQAVWVRNNPNPKYTAEYLLSCFETDTLILDASNGYKNREAWKIWANEHQKQVWDIPEQGAWQRKW